MCAARASSVEADIPMLIENTLIYEKQYYIIVNNVEQKLLYYFDYDDRSASVNMVFQHFHPFYEIMILLAPEAEHLFEGNLFHLSYGDIVLIPPYLLHKSIYRKGAPSKRIIINFMLPDEWMIEGAGYTELLSPFHAQGHIYRFSSDQRQKLYGLLNSILLYTRRPDYADRPIDELMIHTKFVEFLHELYLLRDQNLYANDTDTTPLSQKMYAIAAYIHQHYQEPLTLSSLAENFFINPYYLSHSFKETLNFTLSDYIQITRVKNAQHLLMTTDNKVSDIAAACGFSSFSQFNRVFHKQAGMSPREYRQLPSPPNDQR